jgi:hypothetical protein
MIRQVGTGMSTEETVRKLLEGAQQGRLPLVDEEAPTIDLDTATEWEINEAMEAAAGVTDANHSSVSRVPDAKHPVQLAEALGRCLLHIAVLVIAALDRLWRAARTALNSNSVERK